MKRFLMPAMLLFVGAASLYASGDCGVNPVIHVPSKCQAPYEAPPNQPTGICMKMTDGSCLAMNCSDLVWSNAVPGKCGNGLITEDNVPRCLESYAVTNITLHEYVLECDYDGAACKCTLQATGESAPTAVCNCKDLEPLH
jgi:hypothetical protein